MRRQVHEVEMAVPKEITRLLERYDAQREAYESGQYKETGIRVEFIDPFFKALGWDVHNEQGYAEAYKDVIHEDALKIGGATEAPDSCFRIGGVRKFFVECKKPSVNIKDAPHPAYQLRRYGWSAKLPLSILTDFEEFAVYDCRVKPGKNDSAAVARVMYLTSAHYAERWDEITAIFSRDAVLKGSFDKFAEGTKGKRGTASVDDVFLEEIERWRDLLARNIALRNPDLSQRELNFAVQCTIDRIIFLRICEDRGIEPYGRLMTLRNGERCYPRLCEFFQRADERYNSGLFHFQREKDRPEAPDELTLRLNLDDKVLRDILANLYYPESPYEFSVLSADILGQVYERFLGKVIRLTAGHQAKVEDKPEVRKAGGVFYTPDFITKAIVRQTIGPLLEGKTPRQVAKLRFCDMACGSGSFLIEAFQFLLDWHRDYYVKEGPEKNGKVLYRAGDDCRLTTDEKKRILLNNIFGVDIDAQAVEVTKLSLLLKVLEGESQESITKQFELFHQRALPDLGSNIKCGNSLIGPDFYEGEQLALLDDETRLRVNAFDWRAEFPEIMMAGGFDAIIGNPPYVRQESLSDFKDYFSRHYESFDGTADLYTFFMERGVRMLREGGRFSIIVSSSFLRTTYAEPLRRTLKKHAAVFGMMDFGGLPVFASAKDTYVCIPLLVKAKQPPRVDITRIPSLDIRNLTEYAAENHFTIPHERLSAQVWALKSDQEAEVFEKIMKAGKPLGEYVQKRMFYGIKTGFNEAFEIDGRQRAEIVGACRSSENLIKPFLGGQNIRRYEIEDEGRHLIVIPSGWTTQAMNATQGTVKISEREAWDWLRKAHPGIAAHLEGFADACRKRQDQGAFWWELRSCDYYDSLDRPKIIFPDICKEPRFFLDRSGIYLANTAYCLGVDDPYLLGILNSRLFWFAISNISIPFGIRAGKYRYRLIYQYMEKVPVRPIDDGNSEDRRRRERMTDLVNRMLALHAKQCTARTPSDQTAITREIVATDGQINRLVYELYGLTEEQVQTVEQAGTA
jgi:hypothetical protein